MNAVLVFCFIDSISSLDSWRLCLMLPVFLASLTRVFTWNSCKGAGVEGEDTLGWDTWMSWGKTVWNRRF